MAEAQFEIQRKELTRTALWADLFKNGPPPWRSGQQFIDLGWNILNLLSPRPEIILPGERSELTEIGSLNLIMNHYFFPEIPVITAVIDQYSKMRSGAGVTTAVANMPEDLVIPDSVPILIPPVHYFKRYDRNEGATKNIFNGPHPYLYIFNQLGFVGSDMRTGAGKLTSEERVALNLKSAFTLVERLEENREGIIYPSGDRMPGPHHPGFFGWTILHQYLTTGHVSPLNFWVHEGLLPSELLRAVTLGNGTPFKLLCVDTAASVDMQHEVETLLHGKDLASLHKEAVLHSAYYLKLLKPLGAHLGMRILRKFKERINEEYRYQFPEYDWVEYQKNTSIPLEV